MHCSACNMHTMLPTVAMLPKWEDISEMGFGPDDPKVAVPQAALQSHQPEHLGLKNTMMVRFCLD